MFVLVSVFLFIVVMLLVLLLAIGAIYIAASSGFDQNVRH